MEKKSKEKKMTVKKINTFLEENADKGLTFDPKKKSGAKKESEKKEKKETKSASKKGTDKKASTKKISDVANEKDSKSSTVENDAVKKELVTPVANEQTKNKPNLVTVNHSLDINQKPAEKPVQQPTEKQAEKQASKPEDKKQKKEKKEKTAKEKKAKKTKEEKIEEKKRKKELRAQIRKIKSLNKPHKNEKNKKPKNYDKNSDIIVLENVNKHMTNGYSCEHILKDVSLKIKKGEFVVIYGPSGSGKTTLLTLISALDRPSNGICYMFDKNTISLNESQLTKLRSQHVGYIFQQYGLLTDLSVYDNIKLATSLQPDKKKLLNIDELLKSVDLFQHKYKKASNLSGGQAQRVAICRALVRNPDILYGDEPTGAIHIDATKQIMDIFCNINQKFKTTIVIVTHNEKILELGDHIIKVDSGRIIEDYINNNKKTVAEISWE